MSHLDRITHLRQCLDAALDPVRLEIDDESAHHLGHAGAASGGGHYTVTIVSERFRGLTPIARHRAVYAALGGLVGSDIHAISIKALTPDEERTSG